MLAQRMIWRDFEVAAPDLAQLGRERFARTGVALVGTLRKDGSPRISPVEPYLVLGHLLLGMMSRSGKTRDLLLDSRCSVHSSVSDVNGSEGEFQLHGRAILVEDDEIRHGDFPAWWQSLPREACDLFSVDIDCAVLVEWDISNGEMRVRRWSAESGSGELRHAYP
jgi:pyridoxamine 5'-phosphate oxidase-like protein